MKTKELITSAVFLGLYAGIFIGPRQTCYPYEQEKGERLKFYAFKVISEKNVQDAKDSLSAPDGRYAEILPSGQLTLLMEETFIDSGTVVCEGETDYGLEGWFRVQETRDERQNYAWLIIQREFGNRFLFLPESYILWGNTGVNMIRITNVGTKSLFLDALIGYGRAVDKNIG